MATIGMLLCTGKYTVFWHGMKFQPDFFSAAIVCLPMHRPSLTRG